MHGRFLFFVFVFFNDASALYAYARIILLVLRPKIVPVILRFNPVGLCAHYALPSLVCALLLIDYRLFPGRKDKIK